MPAMTPLVFVRGDATSPQATGPKVIAHICNDVGGWGKGFVLAISKRWPEPEASYRAWHRTRAGNDFALGACRLVQVRPALWIANMIAQHGIKPGRDGPPIRYDALQRAPAALAPHVLEHGATVHMARIGCGLASGQWERIEPLIIEELSARGIHVTVYDHG
jgi:O-acetyl-ADP-ribose deacetylase (regulator of RNase III)